MFRYGWMLVLLAVPGLSCTRLNSRYCEADRDCQSGEQCDLRKAECRPGSADLGGLTGDLAGAGDLATPDLSNLAPECSKDSECANRPATPACVNSRCAPCTRNYQCPDAACVPAGAAGAGACVAKSRVLYVDNNVARCDAQGAAGKPYCRVDQAVAAVSAVKDVILLRTSQLPYQNDGNVLNLTSSVRIVGERADRLAASPSFTDPVALYPGAADIEVALEDLQVKLANAGDSIALACSRGPQEKNISLTLRWMRYDGNPSAVLVSVGCNDLKILSSVFVRNNAGANSYATVHIVGGAVKIANTVIAGNRPMSSIRGGGLSLEENLMFKLGFIDVAFTTIADNACASGFCNFKCDIPTTMNYSIVTGSKLLLSDKITLNNSVTPLDYSGGGTGNVTSSATVPKFFDPAVGDYHLSADIANAVLRLPNLTPSEPSDLDSDPRPSADGKVDVGADQRVP